MRLTKLGVICAIALTSTSVMADAAKSAKHAEKATELRQSVYKLLGSNMGPLGAMAKGKIALDPVAVEKHALRINQLSLMMADYLKTDTSKFDVKTEALAKIWSNEAEFAGKIKDLTSASAKLQKIAQSKDEAKIKKAIGGVGKTCGGCHDVFKKD